MPVISIPNPTRRPPALPTIPTGGADLDRANIDALLRGDFDPYEINMQSAENAVGGGMAGSGFAQAGRYKLLDSEKLKRQTLGNEMLNPYLQREHQTSMQASDQAARLKEIAAQGELAMQQLQASLAGRMAELSAQEKAALERQILSGNQAMEQLRLRESGDTQRQLTGIGGTLANTLLGRMPLDGSGSGTPGTRGTYSTHGFSGPASANAWAGSLAGSGYMDPSSGGGYMMAGQNFRSPSPVGGSIVQSILRQYGIQLPKF